MEEILNQVSNPFDMDNFKRLMELYLNSKEWKDFYAKVVTYYQDREMNGNSKSVNANDKYINFSSMNQWAVLEYFSDYFPTEHRIYINSSISATGEIVQKFVDECQKDNLPFELKYVYESTERNDCIVIGSNTAVYKKHIDILRKIAMENPELIEQCGTPHLLTAHLDNWIGLADENIENRYTSYTQSRLTIFDVAVKKMLLQHLELKESINGIEQLQNIYESERKFFETDEQNKIEDNKEKFERILTNTLSMHSLVNIDNESLKLLFENNEKLVEEVYQIFQKECMLQGINPNNPTLYQGSKEQLIDEKHNNAKTINLNNKGYISIINEYFSDSELDLSVEDELQSLKIIDEKFRKNENLMAFMLSEIGFLTENGIINQELTEGIPDFSTGINRLPSITSIIELEGEDISKERTREIINARIRELCSYFNKTIESIDEKIKCVENLKRMLKHYENNNKYMNYNRSIKPFENKIKHLTIEIENDDVIRKNFKIINELLENRVCTDEEIQRILESCKPKEIDEDELLYYVQKITKEDISRYETMLADYLNQDSNEINFSGQDIGKASYDADKSLCIEADNVIQELQRRDERDEHSH